MLAARPRIEPHRTKDVRSVRVTEIYRSIQGESSHAGELCSFVRLTGCHLRCSYCDSEFAFYQGERMQIDEVLRRVKEQVLRERDLLRRPFGILFSTAFGQLSPRVLAEWIIADKLPVRFQLQMHKYIWSPDARGV